MSMAPWGTLGGGECHVIKQHWLHLTLDTGYFTSPDAKKEGGRTLNVSTGKEARVSVALDKIAKKHNTLITSVAMAYVMHKGKLAHCPMSRTI